MYRYLILIAIIPLALTSCEKDNLVAPIVEPETTNPNVPSAIANHFTNFEAEALVRGITLDLSKLGITAEFRNIDEDHVAGICTTNSNGLRNITIDVTFWEQASNTFREMIVFHELGHCAIGRGHTEGSFSNGICKSIMRSGNGDCRDAYTEENRDYYLDELMLGE